MSNRPVLPAFIFLIIAFLSVLLIVTFPSIVGPASVAAPLVISQGEAESFIRALSEQAAQTLARRDLSDAERARYFRELLMATADLELIGRFVLGRYWRKATGAEQTEFLELFEDISVYTWSRHFREYSGRALTIVGVRLMEEGVVVESTISQPQGPPLLVLWKLQRSEKGLRVTDLVVEGVSMAVTYRSEYGAVIQRSSGKVIGLLIALRAKIDELRGRN